MSITAEHATTEADGLRSPGVPPEASEGFAHNWFTEVPQSLIGAARRLAPLEVRLQKTLKKLSSAVPIAGVQVGPQVEAFAPQSKTERLSLELEWTEKSPLEFEDS